MENIDNRLLNIEKQLNTIKNTLMIKKGAKEQLERIKNKEEENLNELTIKKENTYKAQLFLQSELLESRKKATEAIGGLATTALQSIYDKNYKLIFDIIEEKKQDIINSKMQLSIESSWEDKLHKTGLKDQRGGGVMEIVAFALRIAALNWKNYNGPIILDEAYKSVSSDKKLDSVASFLKKVSKELKRQIIFATHRIEVFGKIADNIIKVNNVNGIAQTEYIDKNVLIDIEDINYIAEEVNENE